MMRPSDVLGIRRGIRRVGGRRVAALTAVGVLGIGLLAGCGGVDRAGTKQAILDSIAGQGLTEQQQTCVANSIDAFTDDELKELNTSTPPANLSDRLTSIVTDCILGGGTAPAPSAS